MLNPLRLVLVLAAAFLFAANAISQQTEHGSPTFQRTDEFLQSCRLQASRNLLLSSSAIDTVSSIAIATGFTYLGRFAALYKKRFGESASESLR